MKPLDPDRARDLLGRARLMLLFTPELCGEREPLEVLEAALPHIDVLQVRVKLPDRRSGPSPAWALAEWTRRALELLDQHTGLELPVLVNDRVDVAASLSAEGCAGVHLGADDTPVPEARELLGPGPLIGLSTHRACEVVEAAEQPLDYLGFGPIHATPTKGYGRGLGSEAAWIADTGAALPLFPIGGIDLENVGELAPVGRAAVSSAILAAADPGAAAACLRRLLSEVDA